MKTSNSLLNENIKPSSSVEIKATLENTLNFERQDPLNPAYDYVVVPQQNFAAIYTIGKNQVISHRLWLVGFLGNEAKEIRSVGINTLTGMALAKYVDGQAHQPIEAVYMDGKWRTVQGHRYIHAMDNYSFVKSENRRAIVKNPIIIKYEGSLPVYRAKFNDDKTMAHEPWGEKQQVSVQIDSMKQFSTAGVPTEDLVKTAIEVLTRDCGSNFYPLS